MFNKNKLSVAIVSLLAAGSHQVLAQDAPVVEEVVVTGIRASLERAMDIKRESAGVVDSISAEDMGKFPDTNLAESLQRITGVSIDRSNGEGSRITVRGFGPDYNMVTLNGRTMPGGSTYGGSSGADDATRGGNARAFDFANLASEAIAGVDVYKTGKANIAAGGIGATVNIKTARPLDNPGFNASVGAKAVHDTTNVEGSDVTPEISGLISWTDDNERFGVSLSASYQERDSGYIGATVNGWNIGYWGEDTSRIYGADAEANADDIFVNAPELGQMFARPNDIRYAYSDRTRERTNAQLTLQFAPTDSVVTTLDFTYAKNDREEHRGEITNWVQNNNFLTEVVFDDSAIKTPVLIREEYFANNPLETRDIGFAQQYRSQEDTLTSIGFNVAWNVNDQLTLTFDAHNSTMESLPTGPGRVGEIDVGIGAPIKAGKTLYFGGDLPSWDYVRPGGGTYIDDCAHADRNPGKTYVTNCNGIIDAGDLSSAVMRMWSAEQKTEITQIRLDGAWQFDDGRFEFGLERSEQSSDTIDYNAENNQILGGWGADNPGEFPDGMLRPYDLVGEFEDFNTGPAPAMGFKADARELARYLVGAPQYAGVDPYIGIENNGRNIRSDNLIDEDTTSVYFQLQTEGQLAGRTVNVLAGLRYENTDVTATSNTPPLAYMEWQSDDDFAARFHPAGTATVAKNSYDALLPNLDVSVNLTDEFVARFSFSKTIARPGLASLNPAITGFDINGSTLFGNVATATGGNPYLKPLESTNFDLSFEYYFGDASYASVGFWEKRVINFIGNATSTRSIGVQDQTSGPLALEARQALVDGGYALSDQFLHAMMVILRNPSQFPGGAAEFDPANAAQLNEEPGGVYDFGPQADDPDLPFDISGPVNNEEAKIHGAEFAVQHFFGETGFGVMANYTLVRGDIKFDDMAAPDEEQFALVGLSDTANLVLMYENYGITARLAYNWRDKFLSRYNVGDFNNPGYVEAHSQIDLNVSYEIIEGLSVSFEGINVTGEDRREYARNKSMLWGLEDLGARYQLGVRYTF
jgi:TonB-dependent receptor